LWYAKREFGTAFFSPFSGLEVDMKRFLLLSIGLLLVAGLAFAQPGSIGVFSNVTGTNCDLYDVAPGLVLIYVVHTMTAGATASQFRVVCAWGFNMTYLAESPTAPYIKIGTCGGPAGFGCAIAYGSCRPGPNMILTMQYFASGLSAPCSYCQVMPDISITPPKTSVLVTDCANPPHLLNATGGDLVINPTTECMCDIPVEDTSWGQIKSLYQ
jgi:hypothetical protein